jgi:hypothetical protein
MNDEAARPSRYATTGFGSSVAKAAARRSSPPAAHILIELDAPVRWHITADCLEDELQLVRHMAARPEISAALRELGLAA